MAKQVFSGFADPGLFEELQRRGSFTNRVNGQAVGRSDGRAVWQMPMALPQQTVVQAGLGQLQSMGQAMPPVARLDGQAVGPMPMALPQQTVVQAGLGQLQSMGQAMPPMAPVGQSDGRAVGQSGGPAMGSGVPLMRRDFFDSDGKMRGAFRSDPVMSLDPGQVETNAMGVPLGGAMAQVPTMNSRDPRAMASVFRPDGPQAPLPQVINQAQQQADMRGVALASVPGRMLANSGVIEPTAGDMMREQALAGSRQERWSMTGGPSRARNALEALEQSQERDRQAQRQVQVAHGTPQVAAGGAGNVAWDPNGNNGRGGVVNEMRPPDEVRGAPVRDRFEQIKDLGAAIKSVLNKDVDPQSMMYVTAEQDPVKRKEMLDAMTGGASPGLVKWLEEQMMAMNGQGGAVPGGQPFGGAQGKPAGKGGAASPSTGSGQVAGPTSKPVAGGTRKIRTY